MAGKGRQIIGWTIGSVIGIALALYGLYQARTIIDGPSITLEEPQHGSVITTSRVNIMGTAKHVTHIALNDRPIFIDESGVFTETTLLAPGYNVIELTVQDRFQRTHQEFLELIYQP